MNVSAIIVTKGDQDLGPIMPSLPVEWEVLVWDNTAEALTIVNGNGERRSHPVVDLHVYGRYAAIFRAASDIIYVQDDDVIVSDPAGVVTAFVERCPVVGTWSTQHIPYWDGVVCNMPQEFRHDFYEEHSLVGFGAAFHRDAPERAFAQFRGAYPESAVDPEHFRRTADIVFTGLTTRALVDIPKADLPYAHYQDRMWKQPGHQAERVRMLDLVRAIA